jgi:hypothetical protein
MRFTLSFDIENAAFTTESGNISYQAISDAIRYVHIVVLAGQTEGIIRDGNGNRIGDYGIEE